MYFKDLKHLSPEEERKISGNFASGGLIQCVDAIVKKRRIHLCFGSICKGFGKSVSNLGSRVKRRVFKEPRLT